MRTAKEAKQLNLLHAVSASAMTLLLAITWCLTHRYRGFSKDAQVYALQALSRLEPNLAADLFFQHTSQDQYTVFSPIYAAAIRCFGLAHAAALLTILFTLWFYAAAWALVSKLFSRNLAWPAVVMPLLTISTYGAFNVFHYAEDFLTARLPAEALIVTALACYAGGRRALALSIAIGALFVHPLIALPGLLLIAGLWAPLRLTVGAAVFGCLLTLVLALLATANALWGHGLQVMDREWTGIVVERSEFLFPAYWPWADWLLNVRGLVCLSAIAILADDERVRRLCLVATLIAAAGIVIACIGSRIGPIGLIMQGQAWRWVWVGMLLSVLLLVPTAVVVWRDQRCGPLSALLLVAGWTLSPIGAMVCAGLASAFWLNRARIDAPTANGCRWAALAIGMMLAIWIINHLAMLPVAQSLPFGQNIGGLQIPVILLVAACWRVLRNRRTMLPAMIAGVSCLAAAGVLLPPAFKEVDERADSNKSASFADWQARIPPTGTVFILRQGDTGAFAWLTLRRPNYLSMDQSAGVIFSRETALEVQRRAEVLLPVKDADWKVHSFNLRYTAWYKNHQGHQDQHFPPGIRPLTAERLVQVCKDPVLGFVIAQEFVGFNAVRHSQPGYWKDWNLYDCNLVRAESPAA